MDVTNQQDLDSCSNQLPDSSAGMAYVSVQAPGPAAAVASAPDAALTAAPTAIAADSQGPVSPKARQNQSELADGNQEVEYVQQKGRKAKQQPKAKQPAKKKKTRKGGKAAAEPNENVSMNTDPLGSDRQCAKLNSAVAADTETAAADAEDVQRGLTAEDTAAQDAGQQQR